MTTLRAYRRVLSNPALARLLFGEFVSSIGDWLYLVALLVVVYQRESSPALLGLVGAVRVLPYVFLSVPAGIIVDRFDRRLVLLVTDVARGVVMVGLAVAVAVEAPLLPIVVLTLLAACFSTFFGPAIGAYLPSLVRDESELGPANSAWASLDNIGFIVGPALAGLLIATGGLTLAFVLNAVSFAIVAAVLWQLPSTRPVAAEATDEAAAPPTPQPVAAMVRERLRPLAGLTVVNVVGGFVFGGLGVLTVIIAVDVLRQGDAATGYLNGAIGLGGVIGAVVSGALVLRRRLGPPLVAGGVVFGLGLIALGQASSLLPALAAMTVAAAGSLLMEVVGTTLFQRIVPDELRGRAFGAMHTVTIAAYATGSLMLPILAGATSVATALLVAGIAMGVAIVVGVLLLGPAAIQRPALDPAREQLLTVPALAGLPPARLEHAATRSGLRTVTSGETIIRQGDPADLFYVIAAGEVAVTRDEGGGSGVRELRRMGPGEAFGEIGLLSGVPRTATVTAVTDATLVTLAGDEFLELVGAVPGLSGRLLEAYGGAQPARGLAHA
ncbi:MAG TPA: MFS transporter [Candidatus Limnocylindria bacterium]|nr:MFS transporter [Candidatus Limnocylindria bacterium]